MVCKSVVARNYITHLAVVYHFVVVVPHGNFLSVYVFVFKFAYLHHSGKDDIVVFFFWSCAKDIIAVICQYLALSRIIVLGNHGNQFSPGRMLPSGDFHVAVMSAVEVKVVGVLGSVENIAAYHIVHIAL